MCFSAEIFHKDREILPTCVVPIHYKVEITPNLVSFEFSGTTSIQLDVKDDTSEITCNTNELNIISGEIISEGNVISATLISSNEKAETTTFTFEKPLTAGSKVIFNTSFTGIHNDKMAGFYRSGYTSKQNEKKWLVCTQFEATDCRRAFPCWDEPSLKATFDIVLVVEPHLTALSNMNVISEDLVDIDGVSKKKFTYATTPIMSTYLIAFAVGELEFVETTAHPKSPENAKPIVVRVYTTIGDVDQGRFGLEVAARTLEFFSEYFDIPYPLPKIDMIAVPDFSAGAMENWGLVTYRTIYLLYDPKNSSSKSKQMVAYVVGHELAHQWFGNLVTMEWWSDLWLNEGFATFVGWLAVDHLYPEWDIWTSFVEGDVSSALSLDSLKSSHPIQVPVQSPSQIAQIFDAISYSKGASVIRMLNTFLGDKFAIGVRSYLKKFEYKNAETEDLWKSLKEASGVDVSSLMQSWTLKMGYPVLEVLSEKYDPESKKMTLNLRQTRFLSTGGLSAEDELQSPLWWIPLGIITHHNPHSPLSLILNEKEASVSFDYNQDSPNAFYKLNYKYTGLYRVLLPQDRAKALSKTISENPKEFSVADRVALIMDSFSLATAGYSSSIDCLEILKNYRNEEDYTVLNEMNRQISSIVSAGYLQSAEFLTYLNRMKRSIFVPKVQELGFEFKEDEDFLVGLKRLLCITAASKGGDPLTILELEKRYVQFTSGKDSALHPNIRAIAYTIVSKTTKSPQEIFNFLISVYKSAPATDQKLAALSSLGATNSLELASKVLDELVLDQNLVRSQDILYPLRGLASDFPIPPVIRPLLWVWLEKNWSTIYKRYKATPSILAGIVTLCIQSNSNREYLQKVNAWREGNAEEKEERKEQLKGINAKLDQCVEQTESTIAWLERDFEKINKWLDEYYGPTSPFGNESSVFAHQKIIPIKSVDFTESESEKKSQSEGIENTVKKEVTETIPVVEQITPEIEKMSEEKEAKSPLPLENESLSKDEKSLEPASNNDDDLATQLLNQPQDLEASTGSLTGPDGAKTKKKTLLSNIKGWFK